MRTVLIVDVETNGLDPEQHQVIEIGCVLWSVAHRSIVSCQSQVYGAPHNEQEIVNRIPAPLVTELGKSGVVAGGELLPRLLCLSTGRDGIDAIIAHNAAFDRGFLPELEPPWVCSMTDIQWPLASREDPSLIHIALDHDLGVAGAHRAIHDCLLIAKILERQGDGVDALLEEGLRRALRPKAEFVALVPYELRELAKDARFRWDADRKQWRRRMAVEEVEALPFGVREVEGTRVGG